MYIGWIEDLLGTSFSELKEIGKDNTVAVNNINATVELKNVGSQFDYGAHHALFFFDLADNSIMTMAVIKLERLKFFQRLKIRNTHNIQCKGYIGCVTFTGKNEAVITYVLENIVKAL